MVMFERRTATQDASVHPVQPFLLHFDSLIEDGDDRYFGHAKQICDLHNSSD